MTLFGQAFLALSSYTAALNGTAVVPLAILLPPVTTPRLAALQWTLTYNQAQIKSMSLASSYSLGNAEKSLTCDSAPGRFTCVGAGRNSSEIQTGILALATITLADGIRSASIGIDAALGADPDANEVPMLTAGGMVVANVPATLSSVVCVPAPSSANCSVTLSGAAPAAGALVTLTPTSGVNTPSSILVASGSSSASFSATSKNGRLTPFQQSVVASYNGVSASAVINFGPLLPAISSLACGLASGPGTSVRCVIGLSGPAPSEGIAVEVSSTSPSVVVPRSLRIRPGTHSAAFDARMDTPSKTEHVTVAVDDGSVPVGTQLFVEVRPAAHAGPSQISPHAGSVVQLATEGKPVLSRLVNAASRSAAAVCSAGSLASVEGQFLTEDPDLQLKVNGETVPNVFLNSRRMDFVCPAGEAGAAFSVSVENSHGKSSVLKGNILDAAPGIFTVENDGQGQGTIRFSGDTTLAAIPNPSVPLAWPAQPGDTLSLYATGLDIVRSGLPLIHIGDSVTQAISSSSVPEHPGAIELQFQVPASAGYSDQTKVFLEVTGTDGRKIDSNTVSIAVQPADH